MLGRRRGFTLAETVVGLAIVGLLAAVLYPALSAQLRRGRSAAVANQISNLRDAVAAYRENVQRYPRTLSQLTNALGALATDACGTTMPTSVRNSWRGPYLTQVVSGDMAQAGVTIKDTLLRSPTTDAGTAAGALIIRFANVDTAMAYDIETKFDAALDYTSGSILWSSVAADTLRFQMLIRNC